MHFVRRGAHPRRNEAFELAKHIMGITGSNFKNVVGAEYVKEVALTRTENNAPIRIHPSNGLG